MTPLIRQLIVTAILALIVGLCTPAFVHRRDFDVALTRMTNKQSNENASVLKAETRTSNWIALEGKLVLCGTAFVLLKRVWEGARHLTLPRK